MDCDKSDTGVLKKKQKKKKQWAIGVREQNLSLGGSGEMVS